MEHSMGRLGGARRPGKFCRCAARTLRASSVRRSCLPRPLSVSSSSPPGLLPLVALFKREAWKESGVASAQCSPARAGTLEGERAREDGKEALCAREWLEGSRGEESVTSGATGALFANSGACAGECARVRVCSGGRGSSWRTPTSNSPARRKRSWNDGTTADRTLNPRPLAPARPALAPSRNLRSPPPRPRIQRPLPALGSEFLCPRLSTGRRGEQELCRLCGPTEGAWCCHAPGEAPLLREAGSVAGDVGDNEGIYAEASSLEKAVS